MVYVCHGVIPDEAVGSSAYRTRPGRSTFEVYLRCRPGKFVSIESALLGDGDALTIDDATEASAEAASIALEAGHAVTFFVNPSYVSHCSPYFFAPLDSALADTKKEWAHFQGRSYDLRAMRGRTEFRSAVKEVYRQLTSEIIRQEFIQGILAVLGCPYPHVRPPLKTVSLDTLRKLAKRGASIGNHGWTHGELASLSDEQKLTEISEGELWLQQRFGAVPPHYAVPFGTATAVDLTSNRGLIWLLLDISRPEGALGPSVYNRLDFTRDPAWAAR